jgi:hypothetical protein
MIRADKNERSGAAGRWLRAVVAAVALAACGSSAPAPSGDGGAAGGDLSSGGGSSGLTCSAPSDCRLYSSYCASRPCVCLALARKEVDPPCLTGQTSCVVDPCLNKTAGCSAGTCSINEP